MTASAEFAGFAASDRGTPLPAQFFSELLPVIDDLAELKLTVFCLWALQQKEGDYRYLREAELRADAVLRERLDITEDALDAALQRALKRGTLLAAQITHGTETQRCYLLNDTSGRALQQRLAGGEWQPHRAGEIDLLPPRPTLYTLYEENIGPLTPMISESLQDAAATYPLEWIEAALKYAVERNIRNWRYISKVLEGWQREGRNDGTFGRSPERRKQYLRGEWRDFIES